MKFPLLNGGSSRFPAEHTCAFCGRGNISEPHSMAVLSGGAILVNRKTGDGGPDPKLDGFLDICWHGAHTEDGGGGEHPNIFQSIPIACDVIGGQFDIFFCSTKCLRAFLNHAVDQLDDRVLKALQNG